MNNYYDKYLSAQRLRLAYQLAPPRVRKYLEAELKHVTDMIQPRDAVLELGCGYGRVLGRLREKASYVVGIDTSGASLRAASKHNEPDNGIMLAQMDAALLGFTQKAFDKVVCIQNGISAFHVDPLTLIRETIRVTKDGGLVIFSSYSDKFWDDRLEWFRIQSENGLLGEIDWDKTGNGNIVCRDGFTASTFGPDDFSAIISCLNYPYQIHEIDDSSVFCEITVVNKP